MIEACVYMAVMAALSVVACILRCREVARCRRDPADLDTATDQSEGKPLGSQCTHPKFKGKVTLQVLGKEVKLVSQGPCAACLEKYLNENSTVCGACGEPIIPGAPVASASLGSPHPYTHMYMTCCPTGALYCGHWGEGELISPFPGGGCLMDVAVATGKPVAGNLDDDGNMKVEVLDIDKKD